MTVRSAKGRTVDFDSLRARTQATAQQDAAAGETSGLARPEETFIPAPSGTKKPAQKKTAASEETRQKKTTTKKSSASDIMDELKGSE